MFEPEERWLAAKIIARAEQELSILETRLPI